MSSYKQSKKTQQSREPPECPICFKNCFETLLCRTPCAHKVCMECMLSITTYECPTCRALLPKLPNLAKARALFITESKQNPNDVNANGVISIHNIDEFPSLNNNSQQ